MKYYSCMGCIYLIFFILPLLPPTPTTPLTEKINICNTINNKLTGHPAFAYCKYTFEETNEGIPENLRTLYGVK